jgi:enamine deaminase RidA (YjgF/YER057c/UK114 family)
LKLRRSLALLCALLLAGVASAQPERPVKKSRKDEKEPVTQILPALPDPPSAIQADTAHLVFHVSPLQGKGLLSAQTREAIKALLNDNRGAAIVKLRAFVAGTGDMRRVQTIVSETFSERRLALPVLTTVQVGALPLENAQVVIESLSLDKRAMNPNGLAFFSGQQTKDVRKSIEQLQSAVSAAQVKPAAVLRATCFLAAIEDTASARSALAAAFPSASLDVVQVQRLAVDPVSECEAVGRLETAPAQAMTLLNPAGLKSSPNYSQIALVNSPKIVLSGTQMGFGTAVADVRLALERLQRSLNAQGTSLKDAFWTGIYPLSTPAFDQIREVRFDFFDRSRPTASTALLFEGLPSLDATFAIEVMALASK